MDQLSGLVIHAVSQLVQLLGVVAVVLHHIGQQRQRFLRRVLLMLVAMLVIVVMGVAMGMGGAVGMGVFVFVTSHGKGPRFHFFLILPRRRG